MNERIQKLRKQTIEAIPTISEERGRLVTEFYRSGQADKVSIPVARAMVFKHLMANKELVLNDGELFVGERGPGPKATPTYPEICTHDQDDLEILHERDSIKFLSNKETRKVLLDKVKPFWEGRSIRDRIFSEVDEAWKKAYSAGVFTEFMEQRAPGHTVLDDKIYKKGMLDFKREIAESIASLDFYNDMEAVDKREQLTGMDIAADALILFAERYSTFLKEAAKKEKNEQRKAELKQMAAICKKVPANKPDTFWEALQYYWFVHLGVITELNTWDSFNPGRLDQHLYPFYKKELEEGTLDEEKARELLQSFWVKFNNQPAPPKVGVTAQESNTYTDFCLINVGGVDEMGNDAVNEMTYMILDVIKEMRLLQPSSMVQISKKNPDQLVIKALDIIETGYGQPSLFNTDAIIQEMIRVGKDIIDARKGGASGCVETGAFGKESYILTGYFNLVKVLEVTLHNGVDPLTGELIGLKTGDSQHFQSYEQLFEAFSMQIKHFVDIKIKGSLIIERLYAKYLPAPFMSILIDDCISKGKDYNSGGARYNSSYIQGVGMGTITDSLSALKYHIFDQDFISLPEYIDALDKDFEGYDDLVWRLTNVTPKYGNDNDYADDILKTVFETYFKAVDGRPNAKGGHFRVNLLPTTVHVYFGSKLGATPDGRHSKTPLSEGISPVQGADVKGPTAVINSAAKIDHLRTGGTLLNQKFSPEVLSTVEGKKKVSQLIRSYFRMDGHHIQFNVVTADTLRKAQAKPEHYKDLIVRVAGYSDYFVDLTIDLQEEIIRRTEQII